MNISEAEAQVMEVLWRSHPQSTEDIARALEGVQDWQLATVKTLLNRLLNKGALSAEKEGRRFLYSPVLLRVDWLAEQSSNFLDRLFDGNLAPLVAHFSARRKLKAAEIKALKKLIEEYEK